MDWILKTGKSGCRSSASGRVLSHAENWNWNFASDLTVASVDPIGIDKKIIVSAYFPHNSDSYPPEEVRLLVDTAYEHNCLTSETKELI